MGRKRGSTIQKCATHRNDEKRHPNYLLKKRTIKMETIATYKTDSLLNADFILTFTGKQVDVFNPKPEMFCIEDIAHALAHTCRFAGHTREFYSVAQHSFYVSQAMATPKKKLEALMHDASDAYLGDMPTPIKKHLDFFNSLEYSVMLAISRQFNFSWPMSEDVEQADKEAFKTEFKNFYSHPQIFNGWKPEIAKEMFLKQYKYIIKGIEHEAKMSK